ncbi:hypothetical protein BDU57DRAFT_444739 [Ampelomyces quisqualis]|uniref:Aminoglycoside phosphotransferase domain-containing protein n=1 Tax=Ampelomyces quisqualis TaxID=50730 RepID=A0A6A5QTK4_AMPQU|nr:hypothetical protein BDU57DRAFT_444739 [Ampelomyces quisqualis]
MITADYRSPVDIPLSQFTKLKLPYEAPFHPDLPSLEDIEKGMEENFINESSGTSPEAEDMIFLKQHSQVRVPDVYAILEFSNSDRVYYHLIMEFVEGEELDFNMWKTMGDDARDKMCERIAEQFNFLRSIPSQGYYGRVYNQGWAPDIMLCRTRYKELCGPYKTYEEFISALNATLELQICIGNDSVKIERKTRRLMDKVVPTLAAAKDREPVFTHVDPALRNMIIRPLEGTMATAKDYEVTLIDWADCGWLPAWVQMVAFDKRLMLPDIDSLRKGNDWVDREPHEQLKAKITRGLGNPGEKERKFFVDFGRQTYHHLF